MVSIFCDECTAAICPEVLNEMAPHPLLIQYDNDIEISSRDTTPTISKRDAAIKPYNLVWIDDDEGDDEDDDYYTILMVDPDAPSRKKPTMAQWLHWLVVNVKNNFCILLIFS